MNVSIGNGNAATGSASEVSQTSVEFGDANTSSAGSICASSENASLRSTGEATASFEEEYSTSGAENQDPSLLVDVECALPPNFSWLVDGLLCACAFPSHVSHLRYLVNHGVRYVVSLTAERDLPEHDIPELEIVRLKVEDFTPPTLAQVKQFIDVLDQAEARHTAVAVHCAAGKGRTGTCIACYFVRRFGHTASQAIEYVRCLRPGSVETSEQAALVFEFESHLQRDSQASTSRK